MSKSHHLTRKGASVSCYHTPGTRYWSNFLVACHMTKPIHNPLRSLMKAQRLGRNVTKKLYGESSNWFTIYLNLSSCITSYLGSWASPDPAIWWQKQPANLPYKAQSSKDPVFVFCSLRGLAAGGGVLVSSNGSGMDNFRSKLFEKYLMIFSLSSHISSTGHWLLV